MNTVEITQQTKAMIDGLKAVCTNFGLGNAASEYKIITEVFLYKFLNDKFIYEMKKVNPAYADLTDTEVEQRLSALSEDEYEMALMDIGGSTAKLHPKQFISYLFNHQNDEKFHDLFDKTLVAISNDNMDIFSVQAGGASKIKLFDALSPYVIEEEKRDAFCKTMIGKLVNDSFTGVFEQKYDFFADIFEYLIKDYNKDSGKYAEYYTPHSIATILARILVPQAVQNVTVYDPAVGTGTLVLALAHEIGENNCTVYTQDISQKANEFMRLNLILNGLVHSLPNVVHDDTLVSPRHLNARKDNIATFDYIASNPPFNMDFSETRDTLAGEAYQKRFFAGVPNIPNKKLDSMAVYQMFLQHIIASLNDKGKAAVVVPTGFLTAGSGIPLVQLNYETGEGLDEVKGYIEGHLCAFCGNSGVGKSTLLNTLAPALHRETGQISQKLGRGRHTTREVEIFEICGGRLADTPGFASLEAQKLCRIPKDDLQHTFPEFGPYFGQCRFTGCSHRSETGCAVREAVEAGTISKTRYASYLAMYEEASARKEWEK